MIPTVHVRLRVQRCAPLDHFDACTLAVEQWLAIEDEDGYFGPRKVHRWQALMEACALVLRGVRADGGLGQDPRVGYDPVGDQSFFIFKASGNGTTYLVSPHGIAGVVEI